MSKNTTAADSEVDQELPWHHTRIRPDAQNGSNVSSSSVCSARHRGCVHRPGARRLVRRADAVSPRSVTNSWKVRWNDEKAECKYPHPIDGPPFGGPGEAPGAPPPKPNGVCNPNRTSTGSGSGNWRNKNVKRRPKHRRARSDTHLLITAQSIGPGHHRLSAPSLTGRSGSERKSR